METGRLIFITGGARSGKSAFAEEYAQSSAELNDSDLHYIATAKVTDQEMNDRIKRHKNQRATSRIPWSTWEVPVDLQKRATMFSSKDIVLLDCLTILLTNEFFIEGDGVNSDIAPSHNKQIYNKVINGLFSLNSRVQTLIVVSNEVLSSPLNDSLLVQEYAQLIGRMHQTLVSESDEAYLVEMGIPLQMKGD